MVLGGREFGGNAIQPTTDTDVIRGAAVAIL